MTMSEDMLSGIETCPYCLGEANGIHKIIVRSDGVAIPCSGGDVCALRARVVELESERLRALKVADALTLDTQSLPEAVDALVEMVRVARRERDDALEAKSKAEEYAARTSDLIRFRMAMAYAVDVDLPNPDPPGRFDPEEDAAILGGVLAVIRDRDAARRDLEAADRDRDDLAMGVGCIKCSDLLPCERHPRTRELVEKYDR